MKRKGQVVSKRALVIGRRMAQWAATGMNWGEGVRRDRLVATGKAFLRSDPAVLDALGREFLKAVAWYERERPGEWGEKNPHPCWWQGEASSIILGE